MRGRRAPTSAASCSSPAVLWPGNAHTARWGQGPRAYDGDEQDKSTRMPAEQVHGHSLSKPAPTVALLLFNPSTSAFDSGHREDRME